MIVLAYDQKVLRLGLSLLKALADVEAVFISPAVEQVRDKLSELPAAIAARARAIATPEDSLLFGLLQLARCAVTKCGYMQVTESLSLHTPVIGIYYPGYYSFDHLPGPLKKFTPPHSPRRMKPPWRRLAGSSPWTRMNSGRFTMADGGRRPMPPVSWKTSRSPHAPAPRPRALGWVGMPRAWAPR
jgi:hypothetical protein